MSNAWVVRSGKFGERDQWALNNGVSGGGWRELPDLSSCTTKDAISTLVSASFPGGSDGMRANYTGQLWALRHRITAGDLLVMPLKTTKRIAIGRVTKGYHFLGDEVEADRRHVVKVQWLIADLPRTAIKQDLLFTLGSAMSVFAPSKNHAVRRLEALLATGIDPGAAGATTTATAASSINDHAQLASVDEPELAADIEQVALDRITGRIAEDFAGHDLATLITAILTAEGYMCIQAPPGPDGGIDITAGRGPLGLDSPRLLTQVKSGSQVGSPVVTQLHGVMTTHGAEQGLLVAWGGLSKPARDVMKNQHLRVRVWEAADVVDAVLRTYSRLPADIRTKLPLKSIWVLGDGDA